MRRFVHTLLFLSSLIAALACSPVWADEASEQASTIKLAVRAIQASEASPSVGANGSSERQLHIDATLSDLQAKLAHLPFTHFHLLSRKEETITLRKKNSLQLPNGQSLVFRPLYVDTQKVGLWLNWRDKDGSEILNTRLHFDSQDSILTGTDCSHNEGVILAINAVAVN